MNKKFVISQTTGTDPDSEEKIWQGYEPSEDDPFNKNLTKEPPRNPLEYSGSQKYKRYDISDAASPERKNNLQYSGSPDYVKYDDLDALNEYEQHARNVIQIKLQQQQKEAESLKSKSEYKDFTKTILTKDMYDKNLAAIKVELERIKKEIPRTQTQMKDFNNRLVSLAEYKNTLENQITSLESKQEYEELEASSAVAGSAGRPLGVNPEADAQEWKGRRDLESLERLIRQRQENIADIEAYIFGLVTGIDQFSAFAPNVGHTNAKFIKVADDLVKKADEEIEDYYNELYEGSEGSPDFGTALEHPKETRNELTTKIHHHKFKKK